MLAAKYTFPHIDFSETIVGSVPTQSRWRSTIGVAGQFRRGPQQFLIQDRQTFARLYGEDNSPGARAVRQMLSIGATDILISRATTEPFPGIAAISFDSLVPGTEARVGYEGQVQQYNNGTPVYTTGLKLTLNYIGDALGDLKAVGNVTVKPTSKLSSKLTFKGQSTLRLAVEDRVSSTLSLKTTASVGALSKSYTALGIATYILGNSAQTLASLNASLTPSSTPVEDGETILFSNGVKLSVNRGSVLVLAGGTTALDEVALQVKTIAVENVLARLGVGSKIYYNNAEIATVVTAQAPTNLVTSLNVITTNQAVIPAGSSLVSQALVATATIKASAGIGNKYKFIQVSKSLYEAFVSNLKPGRVLYSKSSNITFAGGYLTIVGNPIPDPIDNTLYNILVTGVITVVTGSADAVNVALYDSPVNAYIFSSTFSSALTNKDFPDAKQWKNQFYQQDRGVLVDTYHVVKESYAEKNLTIDFLFINPDGTVENVDSGIKFDLPALTNSGILAFLIGGTYQIPVVRTSVETGSLAGESAFVKGSSASFILQQLEAKILQNSLMNLLLAPPVLSSTLTPATLGLQTQITGFEASRVYYDLERSTVGEDLLTGVYANDLLLNTNNVSIATTNWASFTLTGGASVFFKQSTEGSRAAYRDYYSTDSDLLVRVIALSEGSYGNKIKISVNPIGNGQFVITALDEDSASYQNTPTTETLNLSTRDVNTTTGLFNATSNSSLIRAYYVPMLNGNFTLTDLELNKVPYRVAPAFGATIPSLSTESGNIAIYSPAYQGASYLQSLYLQKGRDSEPDNEVERGLVGGTAMRAAIQRLENQDIAILYPAGVVMGDSRYGAVIEEAVGQIKRATTTNGKRRLILQAPSNLNQDQAALYSAQLNDDSISLIAGHCGFVGISNTNTEHAAALYAAVLSLSSPQLSPAYLGNGVSLSLIRSVDTPSNPQYLDAVTTAGVDALYFDSGLKTFKFLNGRTTSSIAEKRQVSIRRVGDEIIHALYVNLQPMRSAPNSSSLRALVAASCDSYLNTLVQDGWIQSYTPTLCNTANNPLSTQVLNQLRIRLSYTPFFPADIFLVDVVQTITEEFDLTLN